MEIQLLPAAYGDAIIIKTMAEGHPFTIVVDGGPEETSEYIAQIYKNLGHIDLMILTHFDADHISGIITYVEQYKDTKLPVSTFWCNCAQKIDLTPDTEISQVGYENANTLTGFLRKQSSIDEGFTWKEEITTSREPFVKGDLRIDVLSPTPGVLKELLDGYNEYAKEHQWYDEEEEETDIALINNNPDIKKSIDELVKTDKPRVVNLWNRASIAFLLKAEGKQILLLGDADADIVASSIDDLYGKDDVLDVDMIKLAHHGSKHNICKKLLSLVRCDKYSISTNGGTISFCHPDRKTLALILRSENRYPSDDVNFYFNYPIAEIEKRTGVLLSSDEQHLERCRMIEKSIITL